MYRRTPSPELVSAVAHHEAGRAVGVVTAFRNAGWLPNPIPRLLVRYVEITEHTADQWSGDCFGPDIYSTRWDTGCIAEFSSVGRKRGRMVASPELVSAIAHHEAGHAVAITMAFRTVKWLPMPPPSLPVSYVEIIDHGSNLSGNCFGSDIYPLRWGIDCITEPYRPLMEAQVVIELAGSSYTGWSERNV